MMNAATTALILIGYQNDYFSKDGAIKQAGAFKAGATGSGQIRELSDYKEH